MKPSPASKGKDLYEVFSTEKLYEGTDKALAQRAFAEAKKQGVSVSLMKDGQLEERYWHERASKK